MFAIFPELLQVAERGDLETLACLVRKYFGDRQIYAPRLRLEPLLNSLGISLTREVAPYFARLQVIDVKGQYHVSIACDARVQDGAELNFTLAHLLGYFLLALQPLMARGEITAEAYQLDSGALARLLNPASTRGRPERSHQTLGADGFAQALLMPIGMVKKAHEKLGSKPDLAGFFQVKPELMQMRLEAIGLFARREAPPQQKHAPALREEGALAKAPPKTRSSPPPQATQNLKGAPEPSFARVQKSVAKLGYQKEGQRASLQEEGKLPTKAAPETQGVSARESTELLPQEAKQASERPGGGLKRLRQLAQKIDRSVDV